MMCNNKILGGSLMCMTFASCVMPSAKFAMNPGHADAPATIQFQNHSQKADTYLWDFGDGTQSKDSVPNHHYTHSGKYDVKLTAAKGKKTNTMTQPLVINPPAKCLIEITTDYGVMVAELYDATPKHRDNFLKLIEQGFYDGLLFHRVIDGFMIQGGDPDSKHAAAGTPLGSGGPGYQVPAEFVDSLIHVKGAMAAARTGDNINPQKMSSGSQFYIVQGRPVEDNVIEMFETRKGITYTPEQKKEYAEMGGTPALDRDYTVFGRVISGLDVIDKIALVQKDSRDRPLKDVKMYIKAVK
ncbi:MAG: peptidylprolyl isomerase [Saprospiraceae bacterium]